MNLENYMWSRSLPLASLLGFTLAFFSLNPLAAQTPTSAADLKKYATEQFEQTNAEVVFKKADLAQKYIAALTNLEKSLTSSGNLDAVVHLREERDSVQKTGEPTQHSDKPIAELRDKYTKGLQAIDQNHTAAQAKVTAEIQAKYKAAETELTKAGKVDEALAIRKQAEETLLALGGAAANKVEFQDDPKAAASGVLKPLDPIKIPDETPPSENNPFEIKGGWMESMTIPPLKQKIRTPVWVGERAKKKWPKIFVSPGSHWQALDQGRMELSACKFIATKSRFDKVRFVSELDCNIYFLNCRLDDCKFDRGGVWYGWNLGAKYYFENCLVTDSFANALSISGVGLRAEKTVFNNIEFPFFNFNKNHPGNFVNQSWLRFNNCRFVKCTVPISVLMLTRDCIFEDCLLSEDPPTQPAPEGKQTPAEILVYTDRCKTRYTKTPPDITIKEVPASNYKGAAIPTVSAMESLLGK